MLTRTTRPARFPSAGAGGKETFATAFKQPLATKKFNAAHLYQIWRSLHQRLYITQKKGRS